MRIDGFSFQLWLCLRRVQIPIQLLRLRCRAAARSQSDNLNDADIRPFRERHHIAGLNRKVRFASHGTIDPETALANQL